MDQPYQHPVDGRGPHPIDILPSESSASPGEMDVPSYGQDVPFWTPDWSDISRQLGWRWILFLPAVVIVALLIAMPLWYRHLGLVMIGWIKPILLGIGLAISTAVSAINPLISP